MLCDLCMPKAFCGLETCTKKVPLDLWVLWEKKLYEVCKQPSRGNLAYYAPPCGGGVGGGATILWARNVRQKVLLNLWVLWEKNMYSVSERYVLCERKNSSLWKRYANQANRKCQNISKDAPPSFRGYALFERRRRPSTFENMPFMEQEHALLDARRACS